MGGGEKEVLVELAVGRCVVGEEVGRVVGKGRERCSG